MASMMNVDRVIHFWEEKLKDYGPLTEVTTAIFIKDTITKLERLKSVDPKSNQVET